MLQIFYIQNFAQSQFQFIAYKKYKTGKLSNKGNEISGLTAMIFLAFAFMNRRVRKLVQTFVHSIFLLIKHTCKKPLFSSLN